MDSEGPLFQRTEEGPVELFEGKKLLPEMVSVKSAQEVPQAGALAGEMEVIAGTGFPAGRMVKASELESPLSVPLLWGLNVLTMAVPGFAMSAAVIAAVRAVIAPLEFFTGVVVRFWPFH